MERIGGGQWSHYPYPPAISKAAKANCWYNYIHPGVGGGR